MTVIPYSPQTWADGSGGGTPESAARLSVMEAGIFDAHYMPAVRVFHNAAQSITSGVATALTFNSERIDQVSNAASTMHDPLSNPTRLTCRYAGVYLIVANWEWATSVANAAGAVGIIRHQGATTIGRAFVGNIDHREWNLTTLYPLAVNEYVEVVVTQNTGGAVNVNSTGNHSPEFMMVRVA